MKKTAPCSVSKAGPRNTFTALMTLFGASQQLLKERMRTEKLDGLGPLHLRLLCLCDEQPGVSQQQLASLVGRDKGQVAHLLHALEIHGLLDRTPDAQDRRLLRMSVTTSGAAAVQRFVAIENDVAHFLLDELAPEEGAQLQNVVAKLLERANVRSTSTVSTGPQVPVRGRLPPGAR